MTPAFIMLAAEAYLSAQRTADALAYGLTETLRQFGLTPTQYDALTVLRAAGDAGIPSREVGARMVTRDPDVTRLLDRLTRLGLAERFRAPRDRRIVTARITPAGLTLLTQLDAPVARLHARQLEHLGEQRLSQLLELLEAARRPPEG